MKIFINERLKQNEDLCKMGFWIFVYFLCFTSMLYFSQSEMDDYRLSTKTQSLQSITTGQNEAETLNAKLIKAKTPKRKPR